MTHRALELVRTALEHCAVSLTDGCADLGEYLGVLVEKAPDQLEQEFPIAFDFGKDCRRVPNGLRSFTKGGRDSRSCLPPWQQAVNRGEEFLRTKRFGGVGIHTCGQTALPVTLHGVSR